MFSVGILASLAFWTAKRRRKLASGSGRPWRAATVISRASLVNTCPRRASRTPFDLLICAHLLWPDMASSRHHLIVCDTIITFAEDEGQSRWKKMQRRQGCGILSPAGL